MEAEHQGRDHSGRNGVYGAVGGFGLFALIAGVGLAGELLDPLERIALMAICGIPGAFPGAIIAGVAAYLWKRQTGAVARIFSTVGLTVGAVAAIPAAGILAIGVGGMLGGGLAEELVGEWGAGPGLVLGMLVTVAMVEIVAGAGGWLAGYAIGMGLHGVARVVRPESRAAS